MTKMTKSMRMVFATATLGCSMAFAQQMAITVSPSISDIQLQVKGLPNIFLQVKDPLFAGTEKFAQGASDVTEVNLDPNTMGMVGGGHGKDADLARKMNFMVIHSYKYDKPGMYSTDDVEALRKKLTDGSWSCSIHVRNAGGSTDICSRTASDHETNEMAILVVQPQKLTFIHMSGKMSLEELNDMSGSAGGIRPRISPPMPPKTKSMPPVPPSPPQPPQ